MLVEKHVSNPAYKRVYPHSIYDWFVRYTRTNKSGEKKYKWKVGFQAHGARVMPHPQSVIFFNVIGGQMGREERQRVKLPELVKCMVRGITHEP